MKTSEQLHLRPYITEFNEVAIEQRTGESTVEVIVPFAQIAWLIAHLQSLKEVIAENSDLREEFI